MMMTLSIIHSLYINSIDFTPAFPQVEVEATIYMEKPMDREVPEGDYAVYNLLKNLNGLKQNATIWFECL